MNLKDISTQLLFTTCPIAVETTAGTISTGTGFLFSFRISENESIPFLITNWHVLENARKATIEMHTGDGQPTSLDEPIRLSFGLDTIQNAQLGSLDLAAIPIGSAINRLQELGQKVFFRTLDQDLIPSQNKIEELAAIESITFIGYPNAIYDVNNKIPLIRRGITSTPIWNDFNNEPVFLIDAGVFEGSSGSPVFIFNQGSYPTPDGISIGSRLLFVGIVAQTITRNGNEHLDLGVVIKSTSFLKEIEALAEKLKP